MKQEKTVGEIKQLCRPRHNARVPVDLATICARVDMYPGKTAHWHYGHTLERGQYYSAFERARGHGLIKAQAHGPNGGQTIYFLTPKGREFLAII